MYLLLKELDADLTRERGLGIHGDGGGRGVDGVPGTL